MRYNPVLRVKKLNPFILDSTRPNMPLKEFAYKELRYKVLTQTNPAEAEELMTLAQEMVNLRWKNYEELATKTASDFTPVA
jgi:pyruvate-ferredoxin/flavodoxin oxidoreductase